MSQIGEELLAKAEASFSKKVRNDRKLRSLARKARDGTSYVVANDYSARAGELLSESLKEAAGDLGTITPEVASEVLTPMLTADHDVVSEVSTQILNNISQSNDIGLQAVTIPVDTNRITGLVRQMASGDPNADSGLIDMIAEDIINYSQSVADEILHTNMEKQAKVGLEPKLIRELAPPAYPEGMKYVKSKKGKVYKYPYAKYNCYKKPCKFCKDRKGTYNYEDVKDTGNDVFRRHKGCRCTLEYVQGSRHQDAWFKAEWTDADAHRSQDIIREKEESRKREAVRKEAARQTKKAVMDRLWKEFNYSPKGASIWYNKHKKDIDRLGIDYMIELEWRNRRRFS